MKLSDILAQIRTVYCRQSEMDLARQFTTQIRPDIRLAELDLQLAQDHGVLMILEGKEGTAERPHELTDYGLQLDSGGSGSLCLPHARYFSSYLTFLTSDLADHEVDQTGVHIPFEPAFRELRTAYDYFLTQEGRVTDRLDRQTYLQALSRSGVTHVEVNGLGYPMALENGPKGETYPMFYTYCPALDQFVASRLNKGLYPSYYLAQNLNYLKENARMALDLGLQPGLLSFEPRSVPECFFDRYPMLRGARVDHPFRSFKPRYNMTITHPLVLAHYSEMIQKLLREEPRLSYMTIWTNDSGAGFEHTKSLYVGRNGGAYLIREWKDDQEIARLAGENALNFMQTLLDAAREINPEFRVITRLESFYGELETMWPGFHNGLEVETNSLVAKGWHIPYTHATYPESGVLNAGSLHHQQLHEEEKSKLSSLRSRNSGASFYLGMGPQVMFAPLMGIPYPKAVWSRLSQLQGAGIDQVVVYGGTFPPEQVPWFINYELIRHFQFNPGADPDQVIRQYAVKWAGERHAALTEAWSMIEEAAMHFPNVSTLYNTIGFAWYRIWTRPLVPDIAAIPAEERAYYEDMMCTTPHNPNNVDLSRDVLFKIADEAHCRQAVVLIDQQVFPPLDRAIQMLSEEARQESGSVGVFTDQWIRARALRTYLMTHRNVAAWITGVCGYLDTSDTNQKQLFRRMLDDMVSLEINNMDELYELLQSPVSFISLMGSGETPLMYGKDLGRQIRIKQELMQTYRHVEPWIDPGYMEKKAGMILE